MNPDFDTERIFAPYYNVSQDNSENESGDIYSVGLEHPSGEKSCSLFFSKNAEAYLDPDNIRILPPPLPISIHYKYYRGYAHSRKFAFPMLHRPEKEPKPEIAKNLTKMTLAQLTFSLIVRRYIRLYLDISRQLHIFCAYERIYRQHSVDTIEKLKIFYHFAWRVFERLPNIYSTKGVIYSGAFIPEPHVNNISSEYLEWGLFWTTQTRRILSEFRLYTERIVIINPDDIAFSIPRKKRPDKEFVKLFLRLTKTLINMKELDQKARKLKRKITSKWEGLAMKTLITFPFSTSPDIWGNDGELEEREDYLKTCSPEDQEILTLAIKKMEKSNTSYTLTILSLDLMRCRFYNALANLVDLHFDSFFKPNIHVYSNLEYYSDLNIVYGNFIVYFKNFGMLAQEISPGETYYPGDLSLSSTVQKSILLLQDILLEEPDLSYNSVWSKICTEVIDIYDSIHITKNFNKFFFWNVG